jgi:predicted outer membrane repeat protein
MDDDFLRVAGGEYEEAVVLEGVGYLTITGGYDEAFTTSGGPVPTIWRSKNDRPLTIHNDGTTGTVVLADKTITKSSQKVDEDAHSEQGGGILLHSLDGGSGALALTNVNMLGNKAEVGGAISVIGESGAETSLTVSSSRFAKNKAFACGAILIDAIDAPPASVSIGGTTFEKNKGTAQGGAICLSVTDETGATRPQVVGRNVFLKNKSATGGAILNVVIEGGRLDPFIHNSVFLKNKAQAGGAIAALSIPGAGNIPAEIALTTVNNTINANKGKLVGAGVLLYGAVNPEDLSDASTVSQDSTNDIIYGNKGDDVAVVDEGAGTAAALTRQYGIFGSVFNDGGSVVDGDAVLSDDPLFVKAGKDIHLQDGSPAIDAGTCTDVPSLDFELDARPGGAGCDIGADEH